MAPVETDNDNKMSARKNLCIVFLHSDGRKYPIPDGEWHDQDRLFRLRTPRAAAASEAETLANAAKFTAAPPRIPGTRRLFICINNPLILQHYFTIICFYI
jgi:hypothetical protein